MFNRIESKKINSDFTINLNTMKRISAMLVSMSLLMSPMVAKAEINRDNSTRNSRIKTNQFDQRRIEYYKKIAEYIKLNNYDEVFEKFWKNGKLEINGENYSLNTFFILYRLNEVGKEIHLISTNLGYVDCLTNEAINVEEYDMIRLVDTTAFGNVYLNDCLEIVDNKATIKNMSAFNEFINNWDGMIHNLVPETDIIENKQIVDWGNVNARTR